MQTPNARIRIMVIDHRAIVRAALELLVASRCGVDVVSSAAGTDTASLKAAPGDRPDVVLLSIGSDRERAVSCLTSLREAMPSVRTLLLTDATDRDLHHDAIRLGAYGVLSPESSRDTFLKALDCISRGEYWIDRVTAAALAQPWRGHASAGSGNGERFATLTARERGIVALIADGLRNKEISVRLNISETTVRHHLTSIFAKLDVSDRLALVVYAFRNGLVPAGPERAAGRNGGTRSMLTLARAPGLDPSKRLA
jgi:DNA-binding NarL/FixJ family response regulator